MISIINPRILCGSSSTRLRPLSHSGFPLKQLFSKTRIESLFQEAKQRLINQGADEVPLGEVHRLSNLGSIPLEIIAVQSGSYLGKDDFISVVRIFARGIED